VQDKPSGGYIWATTKGKAQMKAANKIKENPHSFWSRVTTCVLTLQLEEGKKESEANGSWLSQAQETELTERRLRNSCERPQLLLANSE